MSSSKRNAASRRDFLRMLSVAGGILVSCKGAHSVSPTTQTIERYDNMDEYDIVIIGGGPAGMGAALIAGRAQLRTIVFNSEAPRNAVSKASHGFLTRDGAHASELLSVAKQQLTKYESVSYRKARVSSVRKGIGFEIQVAGDAPVRTKRLIVATGYKDVVDTLGLPGLEDVYGISAFPCPFCDGFEHRNEAVAILGGPGVEHFVPVVRIWSEDLTVFTNGRELTPDVVQTLARCKVELRQEPIERVLSRDGVLQHIELKGGERVARDVAFIRDDYAVPATRFASELGVPNTTNAWGMQVLDAEDDGKTAVEGLYVVGDARSGFGGLMAAARDGTRCVESIVHEVALERWAALSSVLETSAS